VPLPIGLARAVEQRTLTRAVLGVRPEHLHLGSDGPITAKVTVVESLGHERHVICRLDDGQFVIVRIESDEPVPDEGEAVRLSAEPGQVHLFDAGTEERIDG
jgi:ABC-type sugar transport system ATPase subunit